MILRPPMPPGPPPGPPLAHDGWVELWRISAMAGIVVLVVAALWAWMEYRRQIPPALRHITYPMAVFCLTVILALLINYLSPFPPTPGAKFLAVAVAVIDVWVWVVLARIIRRSRR